MNICLVVILRLQEFLIAFETVVLSFPAASHYVASGQTLLTSEFFPVPVTVFSLVLHCLLDVL